MPNIRTDLLLNGMELAADAIAPDGAAVVRAGAVVDNELLAILTSRKVRRVEVTQASFDRLMTSGQSAPADDGAPPAARTLLDMNKATTSAVQLQLVRIAHMFSEHKDDPIMRELCRLAIKCAQERLIGA